MADPRTENGPAPDKDARNEVDLGKILLPKKESGPSLDSASRVNAGALLEQEQRAAVEGPAPQVQIGAVSAPIAAPQPKKEEPFIKPLETYGGDISRVVAEGGISAVSIAAAEARRGQASAQEPHATGNLSPKTASPWSGVLIAGGAAFLLSGAGLVAALFFLTGGPGPTMPEPAAPLISVDQTTMVPFAAGESRDALMTDLEAAREGVGLSLGLVDRILVAVPTTTSALPESVPPQTLVNAMAPQAPQELLRTLEPAYVLGVHSYDENQSFLLLRVDSYQQAYSGMLAWEETMADDLSPLFVRHPSPHLPPAQETASTTATSTASTTPAQAPQQEFIQTGFIDRVVENHDARVWENSAGDILLLWTFLDRNTLLITTNEATLREVVRRVNTTSVLPQP